MGRKRKSEDVTSGIESRKRRRARSASVAAAKRRDEAAEIDDKADGDAIAAWESWTAQECGKMVQNAHSTWCARTPLMRALQGRLREQLAQTGCDVLRLLFRRLVDPALAALLPPHVHTPTSLLASPSATATDEESEFVLDVGEVLHRYGPHSAIDSGWLHEHQARTLWPYCLTHGSCCQRSGQVDDKFQECAHPWSCEVALTPVARLLWSVLTGVDLWTEDLDVGGRAEEGDEEQFLTALGELMRSARSRYETDVLVPSTMRRLRRYLQCRELAALACAYVIDPAHNSDRHALASSFMLGSRHRPGGFSIGTVCELELAMERLHAWLQDLLMAWDDVGLRSARRALHDDAREDQAFSIMLRWARAIQTSGDDLRRRALDAPMPSGFDASDIIEWRYKKDYPFMLTTKFKRSLLSMLRSGHMQRQVILFDRGTLLDEELLQPCPEAARVLDHLKAQGYRIAVALSKECHLNDLGWGGSFEWLRLTDRDLLPGDFYSFQYSLGASFTDMVLFTRVYRTSRLASEKGITVCHVNRNKGVTFDDLIDTKLATRQSHPDASRTI